MGGLVLSEEGVTMNIIQDLIPKGCINRPGTASSREYITIHETGNKTVGAGAKAHANYIKTLKSKTSWHYTVDDESIYQHIPDDEKSYHTSDKFANENSIAIEICVNIDGDFSKAVANAIELVRTLMKKYNIPIKNVKTHKDWTGKKCPAILLSGWDKFIEECVKTDEPEFIYKVQVGAFSVKANAEALADNLNELGYPTYIVKVEK